MGNIYIGVNGVPKRIYISAYTVKFNANDGRVDLFKQLHHIDKPYIRQQCKYV